MFDRFMAKVEIDPDTECWIWRGTRLRDGYGMFRIGSRTDGTRNMVLAHRWSYAHHVGEIPRNMLILHRCDVPSCVNPDHLFPGTAKDNVDDCAEKGRRSQSRYKKLNAEARREICRLHATGAYSYAELGRMFGVNESTISRRIKHEQAKCIEAELFPGGIEAWAR